MIQTQPDRHADPPPRGVHQPRAILIPSGTPFGQHRPALKLMPQAYRTVSPTLLRTLFVAALIAVFWLALQPAPDIVKLVSWQDKIEHAVLFAVLMALGALAWPRHLLVVAAGLLAYGAAMEIAQSFTGYRVGDVWDWLADALGVAAMALPARHWLTRRVAHTQA